MKTAHLVLKLTMAGFLSVEAATAEESIPGPRELPRFRLGLEQTVARYFEVEDTVDDGVSWGYGADNLTADFRTVDESSANGTSPAPSLFVTTGAELDYRIYSNYDDTGERVVLRSVVSNDVGRVADRRGTEDLTIVESFPSGLWSSILKSPSAPERKWERKR